MVEFNEKLLFGNWADSDGKKKNGRDQQETMRTIEDWGCIIAGISHGRGILVGAKTIGVRYLWQVAVADGVRLNTLPISLEPDVPRTTDRQAGGCEGIAPCPYRLSHLNMAEGSLGIVDGADVSNATTKLTNSVDRQPGRLGMCS